MPNTCQSKLTIKGDLTQLNHFISMIKVEEGQNCEEGDFSLNNLYPLDTSEIEEEDLNDYKSEVWGTSYISNCKYTFKNETEIIISFYSTWAPPKEWLIRIARLYGRLTFKLKYNEPGIGFSGTLILTGNNAYTGLTTISAGALRAGHNNALGTTAGGVIVSASGMLNCNF